MVCPDVFQDNRQAPEFRVVVLTDMVRERLFEQGRLVA